MRDRGFTLVELLISIAVLSILAGVQVLLLETGLDAWNFASVRVSLQKASNELMEQLLEGGFEGEGIRDAVELNEASLTSIGFVPLWTDRSHAPDPVKNKQQKFILERQFKPGAPTPVGQVKKPGSSDFVAVPVKLAYGNSRDPKSPDDVVEFSDPIPLMSELRVLYTPDSENDSGVIKFFRWDPDTQRVYESFNGATRDLISHDDAVKVKRCAFLYYDNLNRLIPMTEGESLSSLSLKRATAVKLYLLLTRKQEWIELTSFTNVRNVSTIGATVTEGAQLPMPSPQAIKAFSIGDFFGLKRQGIVELLVTAGSQEWLIRLKLKPAPNPGDLILESFQIESPRKKILTSEILEQPISASEFINLQTLDRSGLYDYDDDEDVKDLVNLTGAPIMVTVRRLDFEGASLFIRP